MKYLIKFRHPKPLESGIRKTYCDVGVVDDENIISEMIGITGVATCNVGDQFNYETGRRLSLARAIAPLPREIRKEIWEQYFAQKEQDKIKSYVSNLCKRLPPELVVETRAAIWNTIFNQEE